MNKYEKIEKELKRLHAVLELNLKQGDMDAAYVIVGSMNDQMQWWFDHKEADWKAEHSDSASGLSHSEPINQGA